MVKPKGMDALGKGVKPFLQFMWASDALRGRVAAFLAEQGLTMSQFGILDALYHLGPSPQRDLGRSIFKSRGNITKVVDNLERDGLVKRERDDADRRYYRVTLTPKGRKIFEKVLPLHVRQVEKEMAKLTENERKHLSKLCIKLGRE
jgi:MarR family 2-MHQ and catechol resistance regulon transcriptional repressor